MIVITLVVLCLISFSSSYDEIDIKPIDFHRNFTGMQLCNDVQNDLCSYRNKTQFDQLNQVFDLDVHYKCSCEDDCAIYGDCCADAVVSESNEVIDKKFNCYPLNDNVNVFAIDKCSPKFVASNDVRHYCEVEDVTTLRNGFNFYNQLVVYSNKSKLFYKNIFCAVCNFDADNIAIDWKLSVECTNSTQPPPESFQNQENFDPIAKLWRFGDVTCSMTWSRRLLYPYIFEQFSGRPCRRHVVDKCPENSTELEHKACTSFTSFVYELRSDGPTDYVTYKNAYCAGCNNVSHEQIMCQSPPPQNAFGHQTFFYPPSPQTWYGFLLDFRGDQSSRVCHVTEFYDPLKKRCEKLFCEEGYVINDVTKECELINVSLNTSSEFVKCSKIIISAGDYELLNDTNEIRVKSTGHIFGANSYELLNTTQQVLICSQDYLNTIPFDLFQLQSMMSSICLLISVASLIIHLIASSVVKHLRNFAGKLLISMTISLLLAQLSFLMQSDLQQNTTNCKLIAISLHYFFIVTFLWQLITSYDIWRTLTAMRTKKNANYRRFTVYSLIAWLSPLVLIVISLIIDNYHFDTNIINAIKPNYGVKICWINSKLSLLTLFAIPLLIIMLINSTFFVLTAIKLNETKSNLRNITQSRLHRVDTIRFNLYLKLALIMGLTWLFGLFAALIKFDDDTINQLMWFPFIVLNGTQGLFILITFTLKKKNLSELVSYLNGKKFSTTTSQKTGETNLNSNSQSNRILS